MPLQDLAAQLTEITGFDKVSLQPNAGASGEYAGLMAIRAYHHSRGDTHRNVRLPARLLQLLCDKTSLVGLFMLLLPPCRSTALSSP